MSALRFGLMTYEAAPIGELVARWRGFEADGWDALWAGDHLWSALDADGAPTRPRFDPWVLAACVATATERVEVGTLVSAIGMRNPTVLAKQAITLDHVSGGRFTTGLGAGGNPKDEAAAGIAPLAPDERAARFDEYAAVVRAVLDGGSYDLVGEHHSAKGVSAPPPVAGRPPLLIAAHLRSTIAVAARHADVWHTYGSLFSQLARGQQLTADESLAVTARRARALDEECERVGRDPGTVRRGFMLGFTQDKPWISVQAFRDAIGRYAEVGITEFAFPFPLQGPHDLDVFHEVVADVLPALRAGERP
ncbi:LLM class flavin-dependent oxidoreductase [Actinosynnema pretiosum subsp. pretiosum]|uniref:Luciferase-like monooxygenase n=2 Tax=Actinosynnema TaxID=40566 RepID=C6WQC3_ACTMD|nr:LLM class flavin-dependent oxidoreductase [Actinosynnema mirum]ACU36777.1 Luciferase-like monooxygenase [Actinosynnema mirum DSM 43827]AXX30237.1 luciferase family protein [Actinosynnema pretiosum subsp. pretiosum]QUF05606.1 LLM class flavin-dependent oxidoreductase [Actinosynnema pretiosum subsp. pretiosum]